MAPRPDRFHHGCTLIVFGTRAQLQERGPLVLREYLERHPPPCPPSEGARIIPFDRTFLSLTWEQFRDREKGRPPEE